MKYEFKEIGLDDYELHYTDKEGKEKVIPFKRTVKLAKELQSVEATARLKLMEFLTQIGKTKKDFIIERVVDGKMVVDETNWRELEKQFLDEQRLVSINEIYKQLFNMEIAELILDMNVQNDDGEKYNQFSLELGDIILNGKVKTPSIQEIKEQ